MTDPRSPEALAGVVLGAVRALMQDKSRAVDEGTPLVGDDSVLDSMGLVELCLTLEDAARERGFAFEWTSDAAMSRSRGMFRSVRALADEFARQAAATP